MAFAFPLLIYVIIRFVIPYGNADDFFKANYIITGIMLYIPMTLGLMVLPVQIMQFKESVIIKRISVTPVSRSLLTFTFILNYIILSILGGIVFITFASLIELGAGTLGKDTQQILLSGGDQGLVEQAQKELSQLFSAGKTFTREELLDLFSTHYGSSLREVLNANGASGIMTDTVFQGWLDSLFTNGNEINLNAGILQMNGGLGVDPSQLTLSPTGQGVFTEAVQKTFTPYGSIYNVAVDLAKEAKNAEVGLLDISGYLMQGEGIITFLLAYAVGNVMSIFCGLMLSAISKSLPMAQALGSLVFFPSMFLTGMYFPIPYLEGPGVGAWIAPWRSITVLMHMGWFGDGSPFSALDSAPVLKFSDDFFGLNPSELRFGESDATWIAIPIGGAFTLFCIIVTFWKFKWTRLR